MAEKKVKANPTKEFFVNMLVRDILLKQAIIELIDNSIDGARKIKGNNDFEGLSIEVNFSNQKFSIKDNCGGIPLDVAENYAFRFGRPRSKKAEEAETTGIFGIGMKRALFKLGNFFTIKSKTKTTEFEIELDVEKWVVDDSANWDFEIASYKENMNNDISETGTFIEVTRLHDEIANELATTSFENEVIEHVQRRVGLDIAHGLSIIVNGKNLVGNNVALIDNTEIQSIKETYEDNGVNVKILAGIAPREGSKYKPENAGWYIYCNGRLVIAADRTSLTTWKDMENKSSGVTFHNDYAGFRGIVYFTSKYPDRLPWNTTKTGLDETSLLYLRAREKMIEIFKIVKNILDEIKKNTRDNDDGVEEKISNMSGVELTIENVEAIKDNREISIKKIVANPNPNVTITYKKPKKEADQLKELLNASSYKEVGEKTFEYYIDAEC